MRNKRITPQECIAKYGIDTCIQILIKHPNTRIYMLWLYGPPNYVDYFDYKDFVSGYDSTDDSHAYHDFISTKDLKEYIDTHPFVVFGSFDSEDTDILVVVDEPIESIQQCRELCDTYLPLDANLATVNNGELTWVFKGTIDEVNNSVLETYYDLNQLYSCPVNTRKFRDKQLKVKRCVRGLLSMCSRTQHREQIKLALKYGSLHEQLKILELISFKDIVENSKDRENSFPKKKSNKEVFKFIAFQLAQTIMLLIKDIEIFTKQEACEYFEDLRYFIYREDTDKVQILDKYKNILIGVL